MTCQPTPGRYHRVRVERNRADSLVDQPVGQIGMVTRPLAADADVFALPPTDRDGFGQQFLHRRIALVETAGHQAGVAVDTEGELGKIVAADGETVDIVQEVLGQQHVGGDLAHHDQPQAMLAALEAVIGQQPGHLCSSFYVALFWFHLYYFLYPLFLSPLLPRPFPLLYRRPLNMVRE